ncbi:MAG: FAD-dependent oxidoreductase [Candidatus Moraniibacteriota bacterium]|nr:MAG: FAD-dependent oxidoreductase [Candidatus Moranbacteria bacterium]
METRMMTLESMSTKAINTTEVILRTSEPFVFTAGQYVTVTLPTLYHLQEREQYREFSLISPPEDTRRLAIVFRNSNSHFKQEILREREVGRDIKVSIEGPKGVFTLPKDMSIPIVFLAGGVGIAPFLSMMRHIANAKISANITLFYYNRNKESAAYLEELRGCKHLVSFIPIFGDIAPEPIESYVKKYSEQSLWYLAGPRGMVRVAREILTKLAIDDRYIKSEEFSGYE